MVKTMMKGLLNNKASLAIVLLLIIVLLTLGIGMSLQGAGEKNLADRFSQSSQALWLADAGIQRGFWEYTQNNCVGFLQQGTATACANCTCNGATKVLAATLIGNGDYDVTLNPSNTTLQSVGSVPSRTDARLFQRRVQASIPSTSLFNYGIFSEGAITISNNALVDSYDSTDGAYGGANVGANGDVGTNATTAGAVTIDNNGVVNGDVSTGVGGTISNSGTITGTQTSTNNISLPDVEVPDELVDSTPLGALSSNNGATITLSTGTYQYSSIDISNNSKINITGDVKLYVTSTDNDAITIGNNGYIIVTATGSLTLYTNGGVDFGNNGIINNQTQDSSKFILYSAYSSSDVGVTLSNNSAAYMAIYAPNTGVDLSNNGDFYGAIVGKTANLSNNNALHYDENLANLTNPFSSTVALTNWQEY